MVDTFTAISGQFGDLISDLSPMVIGFLLLSGYLHLRGKQSGFDLENAVRRLEQLPVLQLKTKSSDSMVPWKDPALLRGGITALVTIITLSTYVLIMLLWTAISESGLPSGEDLIFQITPLMIYPIVMTALVIFAGIKSKTRRYRVKQFSSLIVFSAIPTLACWFIPWVVSPPQLALTVQSLLLLIIALCLSYSFGLQDGFGEARIEKRFHLVEAHFTDNSKMENIRLISSNHGRYHFLASDGDEILIPESRIVQIVHRASLE